MVLAKVKEQLPRHNSHLNLLNKRSADRLFLYRTMQDEFYAVAFRKKLFGSLEQLQQDLDEWVHYYNHERPHSGRYCFGKNPMQTFDDSKSIAEEKMLDRIPLENQNQSVSMELQ